MNRRWLLSATAWTGVGSGVLGLSGCVNVPSSGPIERADAGGRATDPRVEIDVEPPRPGATPTVLVAGFLEAMADYQTDYSVARQFLTDDVRDAWRPESGAQIVANDYGSTVAEDSAVFTGLLVGTLGPDDTYAPARGELRLDLGLRRDQTGEWRIGNPPPGLLMTQYNFERFYATVNLYFFEPGLEVLVPLPISVPRSNLSATALLQKLLRGPADWLRPAVVSAYPERTTVIAAPVDSDGVAEVPLSATVTGLNEQQRSQLAAQTVWTLRQISGVTGVRFLVDSVPYVVRNAIDQVVPVDAFAAYSPVAGQLTGQLFGATAAGVVRIDDAAGRGAPVPVEGVLGTLAGVTALAVSPAADRFAVVVDGGRELRIGAPGAPDLVEVATGLARIERLQFTRYGELIVLGLDRSEAQALVMVRGETATRMSADLPGSGRIVAMRISPDGVRVAVAVARSGGTQTMGLMRLDRTDDGRLSGFRAVALSLQQSATLTRVTDVVWSGATEVVLLAAETDDSPVRPYRMSQDGLGLSGIGSQDNWRLTQLAATPRPAAAAANRSPTEKLAALGRTGSVWRYDDNLIWTQLDAEVQAFGYPG